MADRVPRDVTHSAMPHESSKPSASAVSDRTLQYREALHSIRAIWSDEGGRSLDDIALMATINSVLSSTFSHFHWTGFYRVCGDRLVVGPYIGAVGCLQIAFGKGVCGTAALKRETVVVNDVRQFAGHIACDPHSRSEIVVPVLGPEGELIAVLDVDSNEVAAFDERDRQGLENICRMFTE